MQTAFLRSLSGVEAKELANAMTEPMLANRELPGSSVDAGRATGVTTRMLICMHVRVSVGINLLLNSNSAQTRYTRLGRDQPLNDVQPRRRLELVARVRVALVFFGDGCGATFELAAAE
jgi:hypothetical protein